VSESPARYDVRVIGSGPASEGAAMTVVKAGRSVAVMTNAGAANTIRYFVNTTFNCSTMAEACRVAALNGPNRLF
jgi:succinate dehydrogenase/fumarate reductase flavoprotein subunit